jgi:metal-responsive CopG/Arc/MetJ family transcriptional regulator
MERRYYGGDFQDSTNVKRNSVSIPDHLIKSLNEAAAKSVNIQKKPAAKTMTSEDHANNIKASQEKLANLAKMKAEREARLKELQAKMNKKAQPPPPPPPPTSSMNFGRKKN